MSSFTPSAISRVHFIGIGGIGMSALARFFLHEGKQVSGSDRALSAITTALEHEGAKIFEGHALQNVAPGTELVVYTEAVNEKTEGYVELKKAREEGILTMNYFEALGVVVNPYHLIAVAGTHGKTTTTAMLVDIFEDAGHDPTAIVGSLRAKTKSNFRAGKSKYAIVEACEYKRDFLHLEPDVLVITNIEYEHTDYYHDLADVQAAFRTLALKVPETGYVVADTAAPNLKPVLHDLRAQVVDYRAFFDPLLPLAVPGVHNRANAAAAAAVAHVERLPSDTTKASLAAFSGTWRRFEYKGLVNEAPLYDDYAHHPTEVQATLAGARELYLDKKLIAVFEPHTYSRTAALFDDFVTVLSNADQVLLLPIYAAREQNESGISSEALAAALTARGVAATFVSSYADAVSSVRAAASSTTVVIVMGAGSIAQLAPALLAAR